MPNTDPPLDSAAGRCLAARADAACRVRVIGAATIGRSGEEPADLAAMAEAGAVGFSDDGSSIRDAAIAREGMASIAALGLPLIEHAEDAELPRDGVMREGLVALRLGLAGWPAMPEVRIVERDIALAEETGARLHLTHLSTRGGLEAVRRAASRGAGHLRRDAAPPRDDRRLGRGLATVRVGGARRGPGPARLRRRLPRQSAARRARGRARAAGGRRRRNGRRDRHRPRAAPAERKLVPFDEAAPGLIGLETALSLGLAAVDGGRLALGALVAALSTRPAAIIGETRSLAVGSPADLVRWRIEASSRGVDIGQHAADRDGAAGGRAPDGRGGRLTYRS